MRMGAAVLPNYPSERPAMVAGADKLGIGTAETVRKGVRRAEIDGGLRQGAATEELAEIKRLKCEVAAQLTVSRSTAAIRAASWLVCRRVGRRRSRPGPPNSATSPG